MQKESCTNLASMSTYQIMITGCFDLLLPGTWKSVNTSSFASMHDLICSMYQLLKKHVYSEFSWYLLVLAPIEAHGYDPIPPTPTLSPQKKKEERKGIILDSWSKIDFHWYTYNNNDQALFPKFWGQLWIFNRKINVSQMYSTDTPMREINNIRRKSFFVAFMFAGIFEHVWSSF